MATEKRLIDVTEPLKLFRVWLKQLELPEDAGDKRGVESCINILEDEPTADAVEVVHGHWEDRENPQWKAYDIRHCSVCGWNIPKTKLRQKDSHWNYCPNCGAKMDGDGNGA